MGGATARIAVPDKAQIVDLTELVCWTRMQAEAGQALDSIIARKEIERQAGRGRFCWGVGNAPAAAISALSKWRTEIDVVFSIMKGRPKPQDASPGQVLVWRRYFDADSGLRDLPSHVLITSRADTQSKKKKVHYALMCRSARKLSIGDYGVFDPNAYRNVSDTGAPIGSSQVTALLKQVSPFSEAGGYRLNFRARLADGYWVRLADPAIADPCALTAIEDEVGGHGRVSTQRWCELVARVRGGDSATRDGLLPL